MSVRLILAGVLLGAADRALCAHAMTRVVLPPPGPSTILIGPATVGTFNS